MLAPTTIVQRKCAACEEQETLCHKGRSAPRISAEAAVASLGAGQPLPGAERAFFEPRLGRNLDDIRIHPNASATLALEANAFTLGRDIAFAPCQWRPGTQAGRTLLARELTQVLQQDRGAPPVLQRQPSSLGEKTVCVDDACFKDTVASRTPSSGADVYQARVDRQ